MSRVFITGSTDGLGLGAARTLMAEGHEVIFHARSLKRASVLTSVAKRSTDIVIGDLSSAAETRSIAEQVNRIGPMDAIVHNAGLYQEARRGSTPEGHATIFAVNTLAPYLLTALIEKPHRLIYISSGLHRSATASLKDIDWLERRWDTGAAYAESKLFVTTLAFAVARRWTDVRSNAVDPGWVPTKMGGPQAPDDLTMGHLTQTWLAVSDDLAANVSGAYWHHGKQRTPALETQDPEFQNRLMAKLAEITGVALF